ncbi:MAG: hypothetical protein ACE5EA_10640 [Nitrospirota bacterium]
MPSKVENLAAEIVALEEYEQHVLWEHVDRLNFCHGLYVLSDEYRERLRQKGELDRSVEEILSKLRQIREEIAAHDYPK